MVWKEVKTIENKKSVRLCMFALVLMLMLLLSSTVGTIAAKPSEPPGKPGNVGRPKPPPPPPKYWFYISIGQVGDDVFLKNAPLTAISYVDSCGWNWPPKEGTKGGSWSADSYGNFDPNVGCGIYDVNINAEPYFPILDIEAQSYYVNHFWSYQRIREFSNQPIDFWELSILWGVEIKDGVADYDDAWRLHIWTDWGPELEGDYYPEGQVEVWTVDFNGASWELIDYENMEGGGGTGHVELSGTIANGFNAIIIKGDLVP